MSELSKASSTNRSSEYHKIRSTNELQEEQKEVGRTKFLILYVKGVITSNGQERPNTSKLQF